MLMETQSLSLGELNDIPLPEKTATYTPVPHGELIQKTAELTEKLLPRNYQFSNSQYGIARNGNQMFGYHTYHDTNSADEKQSLSIGFRNSYDKSMSVGFVMGEQLLICSNLMFLGDVKVLKKHTGEVNEKLMVLLFQMIEGVEGKRAALKSFRKRLWETPMSTNQAYKRLGELYGYDIIHARQLPVVKQEWKKPTFDYGVEGTAWNLYQACTHAMKTAPPSTVLQRHTKLHKMFSGGSLKEVQDGEIIPHL